MFPMLTIQLLILPAGKLMETILPAKNIRIPGTKWQFSLNPGPFNIKEHVVISTFASSGVGSTSAIDIMATVKAFFKTTIHPLASFLLILTTNVFGIGFVGFFMKLLVDSPHMWWPEVLPSVAFFRALHEKEVKSGRNLTRLQFFFLASVLSFSYYVVPGYFFPSISALSFVCWIRKHSVTAQQLGSGLNGFGFGSFTLDWNTVVGFTGSPFVIPFSAVANALVGFVIFLYIVIPIAYLCNSYKAKNFPLVSTDVYDAHGNLYNISRILDEKTLKFDQVAYDNYSELYLSVMSVYSYGFTFASIASCFSEIALFHGSLIWGQLTKAFQSGNGVDVHVKMMKKYDTIPLWWFIILLISMTGLTIWTCEGFGNQLQLPYWGVLLLCVLVLILMPSFGVLRATVSKQPPMGAFTQMIMGFKLGLYMKIPPKAMFLSQVIGSFIASACEFATVWLLFSSVENICRPELLPRGSQWTCPYDQVIYNNMMTWGAVGPKRVFYPNGVYSNLFIFFLLGALLPIPVWFLARTLPEKKWIRLINVSTILIAGASMPPVSAVNYLSWFAVAFFLKFVVYRKYKRWWAKYSYLLSVAIDTGVSLMAFLVTVTLQIHNVSGIDWWGLDVSDHCPLATCPTARGVHAEGCPAF
ncbi:oligopeptide transporter 5-like isoform X4 [Ananas comosus]|uniref:Oligopeptide transporter 5-like isoform X4 n=1 Tax=Ananas comosus TaxID=4615 RepID=A0A6P5F108_ANACO|nr:oligopeptide transporter 5-like isoform X4 [Ananas comosus]